MTDIAPITIGHITIHRFAPLQQQRKQIFRKVGFFFVGEIIEDFWFEDIDSGVDGIGKISLVDGFSIKRRILPSLSVITTPNSIGLATRVRTRVAFEFLLLMECDRFLQVKIGDTIATNHQKGII
jgi:hypothetical protein